MIKRIGTKRAVAYCRVSSESQIDNTSIDLQLEKIRDYCRLYDYELVQIFTDNGKSGSDTNRDEYQRMIEYVSDPINGVGAVITLKADRIHRKLKNLLVMIEDVLEPLGIAFISVLEGFDTSTSSGTLFLQMIGSFREFERKVINERTRSGRLKKGKNGKFAGGKVAYGFTLQNGETLVLNELEAEIIQEAFGLKLQKLSLQRIADTLNKKGYRTRYGKEWNKQTVDYILKNKIYCGLYSYNGKKENNGINFKVPKIVSSQVYNKANLPKVA